MLTEQFNSQTDLIQRLAVRLKREVNRLARQIAESLGKPIRFAQVEVLKTAELLNAGVKRFLTQEETGFTGTTRLRRRPHGTVAVITPANNPVFIPLAKIHAALIYGNLVVWKPAPETEAISRRIHQILLDVGFSDTQIRLETGGKEAAEAVMQNPSVSAVTLTGSEEAGRTARRICAERNIPLQAELGGNNVSIVWHDPYPTFAARSIVRGAFEMAGQRCTANRRVIVLRNQQDAFLEELSEAAKELSWGDPMLATIDIGPLVSPPRVERTRACLSRAGHDGHDGVIYPLGKSSPDCKRFTDCWFPPTILCCDDPSHEIVQEESFAPILVVQPARDWEHAIELCNGVRQGLVASIFTHSRSTAERFLEDAEAGILKINQSTSDAEVDVPFCAWKASGTGLPKHGEFNREFYTRPQTVYGDLQ